MIDRTDDSLPPINVDNKGAPPPMTRPVAAPASPYAPYLPVVNNIVGGPATGHINSTDADGWFNVTLDNLEAVRNSPPFTTVDR